MLKVNKFKEDEELQTKEGQLAVRFGDVGFVLPAMHLLYPHNAHTVKLKENCLRVQSDHYDHKIDYSDIRCHYLLKYPNENNFIFIVCLNDSHYLFEHTQQTYFNIVWLTENMDVHLNVNLTKEEIEKKFKGRWLDRKNNFERHNLTEPLIVDKKNLLEVFQLDMSKKLHELIACIFKRLTRKKVKIQSRTYINTNGDHCVGCVHGERNGWLYPNDKSFIFLHEVLYCSFVYIIFRTTSSLVIILALF